MHIPQNQNLHKQSFISDKLEFVWLFQLPDGILQFVFGINAAEKCYIESGQVDAVGNYIGEPFFVDDISPKQLTSHNPPGYNNFHSGQDLIDLANVSLDYLR